MKTLTPAQIETIRAAIGNGASPADLAKTFGVTLPALRKALASHAKARPLPPPRKRRDDDEAKRRGNDLILSTLCGTGIGYWNPRKYAGDIRDGGSNYSREINARRSGGGGWGSSGKI